MIVGQPGASNFQETLGYLVRQFPRKPKKGSTITSDLAPGYYFGFLAVDLDDAGDTLALNPGCPQEEDGGKVYIFEFKNFRPGRRMASLM
ncbi:MAG: hypothetical protein CM15mP51_25270 [Porticoccaceae bacterium]|nr:MAG: hypothetical protein CM15mP51_25270 [Porticoccaceae bacterium]